MQGKMTIKLGGEEKHLLFNNFASIEIAKLLFDGDIYKLNPNDVILKLQQIGSDNSLLLMKYLIYGGILGYDYEVGFKATVTPLDVGKWMGSMSDSNLIEIWDCFLKSQGFGLEEDNSLSKIPEDESTLKAEKKN